MAPCWDEIAGCLFVSALDNRADRAVMGDTYAFKPFNDGLESGKFGVSADMVVVRAADQVDLSTNVLVELGVGSDVRPVVWYLRSRMCQRPLTWGTPSCLFLPHLQNIDIDGRKVVHLVPGVEGAPDITLLVVGIAAEEHGQAVFFLLTESAHHVAASKGSDGRRAVQDSLAKVGLKPPRIMFVYGEGLVHDYVPPEVVPQSWRRRKRPFKHFLGFGDIHSATYASWVSVMT